MFYKFFSYKPMRDLAKFLLTYNCATQAVVLKSTGASPDLAWTGTAPCILGGQLIQSLTPAVTVDLSSASVCDYAGGVIPNGSTAYFLILSAAVGTPYVMLASAISASPTLKIPNFDPTLLVAIAVLKYANNTGGDITIGTSNLANAQCTFTQLLGPVVVHVDNADPN